MDASLTELLPRLFGSMAVVLVVMWGAARVMKNKRIPGLPSVGNFQKSKEDAKRNEIEVLSRTGLSKNATVTLVRAGGKTLLLGVTDAQVTLLSEIDEAVETTTLSLVAEEAQSSSIHRTGTSTSASQLPTTEQAWKGLLSQVRERTVRRA